MLTVITVRISGGVAAVLLMAWRLGTICNTVLLPARSRGVCRTNQPRDAGLADSEGLRKPNPGETWWSLRWELAW
jgi:hypothetical protein